MKHQSATKKALLKARTASAMIVHALRAQLAMNLALVALLAVVVSGCQKQNKAGEAFVVLKSGEVVYMADMEVVCLKAGFKSDLDRWRTEYHNQSNSLVREIETGNPTVKAKLKEIDGSIVELNGKITAMSGDERNISASLARASESARDKLLAELAQKDDVLEEYKAIVEPIDKRISELVDEGLKAGRKLYALATETIQKVNANIVESKVAVPKLQFDDEIEMFAIATKRTYDFESRPDSSRPYSFMSRGVSKSFLVEKKAHDSGSDWVFLINVPEELEGGHIGADVKTAYQKWCALTSRVLSLDESVHAQKARKDEELIPWKNRHGKSEREGQKMVEREAQQRTRLASLNQKLGVLQADGTDAKALVQTEIARRVAELDESLASLRMQRKDFLLATTEKAKSELAAEFKQKFYTLLKMDALASVRAGSKGDFIVPGEAAFLFAETQRNNGERLAWLIAIDPKSPKVKMSVSNAASAGGYGNFDDFWMLKVRPSN